MVPGQVLGGITATLGSLLLGVVDSAGVAWSLATLDGWDSPDVRSTYTDRESDHGAWAGPTWLGSRPVTLAGTITAPDGPSLDVALEQLAAAVSFTDTVLVVNESIPKQAIVRRSGKLLMQRVTDRIATYSALVTAADSRRYAATQSTGSTGLPSVSGGLAFPATFPVTLSATTVNGAVTAANAGSMESRPVLTVAGPVTGPVQIIALYPDGSTRILTYTPPVDLVIGDLLVIDTDAHTVTLGGASRRRWMSGPWPNIPAGQTVQFQFRAASYSASALLTATWRSAWM